MTKSSTTLSKTRTAWVEAAILYGLKTNRVPRKAVVAIAAISPHINWPAWLTGDKARRIERGVFSCPEIPTMLAQTAMAADEVDANAIDAEIDDLEASAEALVAVTA